MDSSTIIEGVKFAYHSSGFWTKAIAQHQTLNIAKYVLGSKVMLTLGGLSLAYLAYDNRQMIVDQYENIKELVRPIVNYAIYYTKHEYPAYTTVRDVFSKSPLGNIVPGSETHSHPIARAERAACIGTISTMAMDMGLRELCIQPRLTDVTNGKDYAHSIYWARDSIIKPSFLQTEPEHIISMVDVDYYVNMPEMMTTHVVPYLLKTMTPAKAATTMSNNRSYTFIDNTLHMTVSGGAQYEHELWNYSEDHVTVWGWGRYWIPTFCLYVVERRSVSEFDTLVCLVPQMHWRGLFAFIAKLMLKYNAMQRSKYNINGYTVIRTMTADTDITSIALQGNYTSIELTTNRLEMFKNFHYQSKMGYNPAMIKMKDSLIPDEQVSVLNRFLCSTEETSTKQYLRNYRVEYGVMKFDLYPESYDPVDKPCVTAFMNPVVNGTFAPSKSLGSAVAAAQGRIVECATRCDWDQTMKHLAKEFIFRVIPANMVGRWHPKDFDHVWEQQDRPSQRIILNQAAYEGFGAYFNNVFNKSEAYGKITHPRVITTPRAADKLDEARFEYAKAEFLKLQPWYGFGKTPLQIATRVANIAVDPSTQFINCGDYTRMDGHKTIFTRTFNLVFNYRLFAFEHHPSLRRIADGKVDAKTSTQAFPRENPDMQHKFRSGVAHGSGQANTSNDNTLDDAFITWLGYYFQTKDFDVAYKMLCNGAILAGDDSLCANLDGKHAANAAKKCGHILKPAIFKRGEPGVNFLARIYTRDVWGGYPGSCTDIMRCLSKLHTTHNLPHNVTEITKLEQKLTSLYYTDKNTPIIREILSAYIRVGGKLANKNVHKLQSYWAQHEMKDQYPNEQHDDFMIGLPEYGILLEYLDHITTLEELLKMPCIYDVPIEPHTQQSIVSIDGEPMVLGPDATRTRLVVSHQFPPKNTEKHMLIPPVCESFYFVCRAIFYRTADPVTFVSATGKASGRLIRPGRPAKELPGKKMRDYYWYSNETPPNSGLQNAIWKIKRPLGTYVYRDLMTPFKQTLPGADLAIVLDLVRPYLK